MRVTARARQTKIMANAAARAAMYIISSTPESSTISAHAERAPVSVSPPRALALAATLTCAASLIVTAASSCDWHTSQTLLVAATGLLAAAAAFAALRRTGWIAAGSGAFSAVAVSVAAGLVAVVVNLAAVFAVVALFVDCGGV
jgi:hypothetical protein